MKTHSRSILTNGWGERILFEIGPFLEKKGIVVTRLRKDLGEVYNDYTTYKKMISHQNEYPVFHFNSWFDIFCLFQKNKKNAVVFESHALHPGLNNVYARSIIESPFTRALVWFFGPVFTLIFRKNIGNVDLYLVSTPGFLESAKKARTDAEWLPNPVFIPEKIDRVNTLALDGENINIFYPTGLRRIKNPEAAMELLENLRSKYRNLRIYLFESSTISSAVQASLDRLNDSIVWLPLASQEKMREYYAHDWNLVIGSFYDRKPYAILNMIELESIAYRLPVIAIDLYEVLKYPIGDVESLAQKLIEDSEFRKGYIEKNLAYIREVHSPESVSEKYLSLLESHIFTHESSDNGR